MLDATRGDRPDGEIPSYAWDLDGDGKYDDAFGATVPFTPVNEGDVKVGLRATTSDGKSATAQAVVHVTNAAPVLSVVGGKAVVGQEFTLPVMVSDPGANDELIVFVQWGDDSDYDTYRTVDGRVHATHTYDSVGGRLVTVEVCDDAWDWACTEQTVAVSVRDSAPPEVSAVLPDHGDKRGGTEVVVNGSLLTGATSVHFGSVPATAVRVVSDRQLVATAPPLLGGAAVDVTVTSAGGTSAAVPTARFTADNTAPQVDDVSVSTAVDAPVRVPVAASDADDDALTLTVAAQPSHGIVSGPDGAGAFTYTPAVGWDGNDSFVVQVSDGVDTARGAVHVRVGSRAPLPGNDTVTLPRTGGTIDVAGLLANDVDPEGDALSAVSVGEPSGAVSAVALAGDAVTVTVGAGEAGSFAYTVRDATGMRSTATVFVGVAADGGGAPYVAVPAGSATGNEGEVLTTSGQFIDPDGDPLTLTLVGPGTLAAQPDGSWTWSLATRDDVSGTVTITATDGKHGSATDTFTFRAVNVAPAIGEPTVTGGSCGAAVRLRAVVTDPGLDDVVTTVVAWGDGSTSTSGSEVDLTHTYKGSGTWTVTITATDDDGGRSEQSVSVNSAGGTRPGGFEAPLDRKAVLNLGSTVPVKVTVRDCSGGIVTDLEPRVSMVLVSGGNERPVNVASAANNTGDVVRVAGGQYIYNLSLKNSRFADGGALVAGTYRIRVSDPSFISGPVEVTVTLQK